MRCPNVLTLAFLIAFAGAAVGQPAAPPAPISATLAADTALTTASGATFTAPREWSVTSGGQKTVLVPPEADLASRAGRRTGCGRRGGGRCRLGELSRGCKAAAQAGDTTGAVRGLGGAAQLLLRNVSEREGRRLRIGVAGGAGLDGRHRRGQPRHLAKAQCRVFSGDRQLAAKGLSARDVRRQGRSPAGRRTHRTCSRISSRTSCASSTFRALG